MNDDPRRGDASSRHELASTIGIIAGCVLLAAVLTGGVWAAAGFIIPFLIGLGR